MGRSIKYLIGCLTMACFIGCANRGIGPQGGPVDTIAPVMLKSVPENGALNFHGRQLEVTYNEYLQLDNVSQNLLMSPPQKRAPEVKVRGKRVHVEFIDTLRENTTYTLDFGNSVCDFTERNAVPLIFAFSTGPVIDTLEVQGNVYDAENLNPLKDITVGIYRNLHDSAFSTTPFDRIGRTDTAGFFRIGNMQEGTYRLYAVDDVIRDYCLTAGEAMAFADETVSPEVHPHYVTDSLGRDSLIGYDYGPADLQLWIFRQQQQRLYLQRSAREKQHMMQFAFSASPDSLPTFRALPPSAIDSTRTDEGWIDPMDYSYLTYSAHGDTVTLWLTDSISIAQDSIWLEARYRRTDSLFNLVWATDTLRTFWRAPRLSAKALKLQAHRNKHRKLELRSNAASSFEMYDTLFVASTSPLATIEQDSIHLYECVDTILKPLSFTIEPYDTMPMRIRLLAPIKPGKKYELQLDSAALHDIYGVPCKEEKYQLHLKQPEDYATIQVKIEPFIPNTRIQLLNTHDDPVRELPADPAGTWFRFLRPDSYYMRLYIDANGDEQWTTGSWEEHRQPEIVYYFPEKIQTKANWDFEFEWNYMEVDRLHAKPAELIKTSVAKQKKK